MVHEHYSGIRMVKAYGIEDATKDLFSKCSNEAGIVNRKFAIVQGVLMPMLAFVTRIVSVILVVTVGAIPFMNWKHLRMADFISFMWIQSYILGPLMMLSWILPLYQRGRAAYIRLLHVYQEPIEIQQPSQPIYTVPANADIEIRHLTFTYSKAPKPTLTDINFHIKAGTFTGITGPIGAGKTTLFRLLNREYDVPAGTIFIGEHDIREYDIGAFHQDIVTVEQLPFLFSKSIRDNVSFGKYDATQDELEQVAQLADLHETILQMPAQYNTIVGERGFSLSGGQKQRVAIARAFLVNRSIVLLDDIFAALDAATEQRIFEHIKQRYQNKTIVLITHRISILEQLDKVIYLDNGRIVEQGSPQELKQKNGPYAALKDLQRFYES
jgi:ATP-binding cassette subfamily B protein